MTISTSTCLNLYYLLTIRYNVTEETLKRYLEPSFLVFNVIVSFIMPVTFLKSDYLNPTPYETTCAVGPYPFSCNDIDIPCIRGRSQFSELHNLFRNLVISSSSIEFVIFTISMALIIDTFYKSDRELAKILREEHTRMDHSNREERDVGYNSKVAPVLSRRFMTKIITQQALMYFSALVLTWVFLVISFFKDCVLIAACKMLFVPLRGTLNMLIFVYHKVYAMKMSDDELTYFQGLILLIDDTKNVPEHNVSNIEIVSNNTFELRVGQMYKGLKVMDRMQEEESVLENDSILEENKKNIDHMLYGESVVNHIDGDEDISTHASHDNGVISYLGQYTRGSKDETHR